MGRLAPERIVERLGSRPGPTRDDFEAVLGGVSEGVLVRAPDGRTVFANEAAARLLGAGSAEEVVRAPLAAFLRRFELFDGAGRPLDPAALPGARALAGEEGGELVVRFRPLGGGEEQVAHVRARRVADGRGELRHVVSYFRTVTEEHAAETLRKLEHVTKEALSHFSLSDLLPSLLEAIERVLEAETAAILLLDDSGRLTMRVTSGFEAEQVSLAVPVPLGRGMAGGVAASATSRLVEDLDEIELVSPVLRARGIRSLVAIPLVVEGRVIGVAHAGSTARHHFDVEDVRLFELIGDRIALAVNHSALLDAERDAQERLAFLGEASAVLGSSLSYEDTLARLADLAVPRFADWCAVDLLAEDGARRIATGRVGRDGARPARGPAERAPADLSADRGLGRVLRTGEPELLPELGPELLEAVAREAPEVRELVGEPGAASAMIVPVSTRGRTLGALSFLRAGGGRRYGEADLELALDLARRAGVAVDNAHLYREAEERAQAARVLASVGDGVVLVDASGVVRYLNRAAEAITGLPRSAVVDRPAVEAVPGWSAVVQRVPIAVDAVSTARALSLPLGLGDRELWLSVTGVAVIDGTVYAFRDMTEERALEVMRSEFVSTVSHELRTPLAAIYGAAMTLRRDDVVLDADQSATLLNVITNESDRLARTVNAILWASRLDTDALSTAIETCDPMTLAKEVVDAQRVHLPERIRLELESEDGVPPLSADPDKVRQVLVNLLDNAVKYSPDGGVVRLRVSSAPSRVRFSVVDEGLGIPYGEQRRIFDKFYRLDPDMTRGIGGTGLGLYICRELVRRMEGQIWVTSEPGRGSTFAFDLPAA